MRFEWDDEKAATVEEDHGIKFSLIINIFEDLYAIEFIDEIHLTEDETRYKIIGLTPYGLICLVYTMPSDNVIRFITAVPTEKWMVRDYEENRKES